MSSDLHSLALAQLAARILLDKKGSDVVIFNVQDLSSITDFYVMATGSNTPHLKALFQETRLRLKQEGISCYRKSGEPESGWIVADYFDIVVHLLTKETRAYYALEELWSKAPRIIPQ